MAPASLRSIWVWAPNFLHRSSPCDYSSPSNFPTDSTGLPLVNNPWSPPCSPRAPPAAFDVNHSTCLCPFSSLNGRRAGGLASWNYTVPRPGLLLWRSEPSAYGSVQLFIAWNYLRWNSGLGRRRLETPPYFKAWQEDDSYRISIVRSPNNVAAATAHKLSFLTWRWPKLSADGY